MSNKIKPWQQRKPKHQSKGKKRDNRPPRGGDRYSDSQGRTGDYSRPQDWKNERW